MCLSLRSLVSRFVPLFVVKTICFQLGLELEVLNLAKLPSWIGVEKGHLYPIKEGPTLKPSSLKLGRCEGRK